MMMDCRSCPEKRHAIQVWEGPYVTELPAEPIRVHVCAETSLISRMVRPVTGDGPVESDALCPLAGKRAKGEAADAH